MIDRKLPVLILAIAVALLSACSRFTVRTDYAPDADFDHLQTFAWHTGDRPASAVDVNQLNAERITTALEETLTAKGYSTTAEGAPPDFRVAWHVVTEDEIDVDTYYAGVGYYRSYYGGFGTADTVVRHYTRGSLIVDVLDAGGGRMLWQGTVSTRLRDHLTPEERSAEVRQAVAELLTEFPPDTTDG